MTVGWLQVGFV